LLKVYENDFAIVQSNLDLRAALIAVNNAAKSKRFKGFSVVLDNNKKYVGVLTDGDLRRLNINNVDISDDIANYVSSDSVYLTISEAHRDDALEVISSKISALNKDVSYIPVIDENGYLVGIVNRSECSTNENVAVYGLGFVGITLSGHLASNGVSVTGIDVKESLVHDLQSGIMHVREPALPELIAHSLKTGNLILKSSSESLQADVHIVSVGTPVNRNAQVDDRALRDVVSSIGLNLKRNDLVILRSTVPMGTTRKVVIPMLEKLSALKVGSDFFVSFAPERTVEGDAIRELRELPQIIGGYSEACTKVSYEFWNKFSGVVVVVESLEAAELVKLANNSYRDLSFAFANQIGLMAEEVNIDAFDLISKANSGYPRNKIPLPSPGVGGYCLTKDPYLLESSIPKDSCVPIHSLGRAINDRATLVSIKKLEKHAARINKKLTDLSVLVVGIAFKGLPETNDLRGSCAVDLINELGSRSVKVRVWDAVITSEELLSLGFDVISDLSQLDNDIDAVLVMNNHPENRKIESSVEGCTGILIFDGWHTLDKELIKQSENLSYSTIGFME